jgi:hypothetical protein
MLGKLKIIEGMPRETFCNPAGSRASAPTSKPTTYCKPYIHCFGSGLTTRLILALTRQRSL